MNDLFGMLAELCEYGHAASYGPHRAGDIGKISLDAAKIGQDMGWAPETEIIDGLASTVEWFRENPS